MIRRILVSLGAPEYLMSEVRHAVELADRYNAQLTGVTVVDAARVDHLGGVPLGATEAAQLLRDQRRATVRQHLDEAIGLFEATCREAQIRYQVKREERSSPFDLLISQARYHDLVVCGLQGMFETGWAGTESTAAAGETLARLISGGVRPLVAVARQYRPIRRVFIAYSGSAESAKTLKQFIQYEPWFEVTLRIVVFNHTAEKAARLLASADEYCRAHGRVVEVVHVPGNPRDQILPAAADWGADLLVLGNSAGNLLLRRVLGETALHVMQRADRPLFLSQ